MPLSRYSILATFCGVLLIFSYSIFLYSSSTSELRFRNASKKTRQILSNDEPLVFIGGIPRSGTTLLRAMLDAHENLRCGEETIVVPFILGDRERWSKGMLIGTRVTDEVVDAAVSAFISEIIAKHGAPAQRYCNKDPFSAWHYEYLGKLYPNAKFLLVVRDPRAVVHSILSRQLPVSGFITSDIEGCFRVWNSHMEKMIKQCKSVGDRCLLVHYESLVLTPREEMTDLLAFLEEPFSEKVLEHEKLIGTDIQLNPLEFSTGQVAQRLYQSALHLWKNYFSESLLRKVGELAPLMEELGYVPSVLDPDYAQFRITKQ